MFMVTEENAAAPPARMCGCVVRMTIVFGLMALHREAERFRSGLQCPLQVALRLGRLTDRSHYVAAVSPHLQRIGPGG
jgi:hypothetical protein